MEFLFKTQLLQKAIQLSRKIIRNCINWINNGKLLTKLQSVSVIKFKFFLDLLTAMPFISSYYHRHIQRVMTSHDSPTRIYKAYKIKLKKLKEQKM